ncbi:hypothetical protein EDB89DRAFT_1900546 [Lactarius sanguifluus]|nr:hypothetical protein EDB89DRAFT_1900546 [Lactarius sanguifluus]
MPSTSFQPILDAAFADYTNFKPCHSPDDVLKLLEAKANEFKDHREGNRKLIDCLKPVVNVIHAFSGVLGEAVSLAPFQPAKAIFVGVGVLLAPHGIWVLQAASSVSSSYDALVDLFDCVGNSSNAFESTPISR